IDSTAIVIGSKSGRVWLTAGAATGGTGVTWNVIANPADLDSTYAQALAFGSRNPVSGDPDGVIYSGTVGGKIFITYTRGGFNGSTAWRDISAGLDGSPVMQIVTNPKPGSHEAFAVTTTGVFWMPDAGENVASPTWVKISDRSGTATTINQAGGI